MYVDITNVNQEIYVLFYFIINLRSFVKNLTI